MDEKNIKEILQIILDSFQSKEFIWRLEGSVNLKIQGVDVSVQDLDITTNDEGIEIFRSALKKFIVKDFFSQKINGRSLVCNINNFEIEINSYGDRKLDMFEKTEKILWNDLQIPILPLEYAKKFYKASSQELQTPEGVAWAKIFARDVFSYWQPLDEKFLAVLIKLARYKKVEFVSPFWSNYFFCLS